MWVYWATLRDTRNKIYKDVDFIEILIIDEKWQIINDLMYNHTKPFKPVECGFGGDDQEGFVVLREHANIPNMEFELDGISYIMNFGHGEFTE
jgi:hypothetical protein